MSTSAGAPATIVDPAWIELADGTRLCARIWMPATAPAEPVPAILEYLPYRKDDVHSLEDALMHPWYAAHGYAAVRVDIRGSGDSDGILTDEYSAQEHADALEVIAWIAAQPWCTGAVGMTGISWSGFNSLQIAALRPPALKAIITACSTDDRYDNDVHYLGGVPLGYYLLPWASALMSFNARPPVPGMVGDRWRGMWRERLDDNVDLAALWLRHQARDEYWRHGSICEDYSAIRCAVFAVGGWADAYVDAILRMLERLPCPRRGLIGPWGHQFPQTGWPGPRIGFLQEALRFWDHWLKGADNGAMDGPLLRAWMADAVRPAPDYAERSGRWVAEDAWPPPTAGDTAVTLALDGDTDAHTALVDPAEIGSTRAVIAHCSSLTVGVDAGAWCAYGAPADMPADQRREDAQSLSFDTAPLAEPLELLGQPTVTLRAAADRPAAFVVARLCDVWPDGSSTLITRGVLNLCHRHGHDRPEPLTPGEAVDVTVTTKGTGYSVPAGHRLRLALSTSYWPWLWPSPEPVTLSVHTGGASALHLPARAPAPQDEALEPFGPAETSEPLSVTWLRAPQPSQTLHLDPATGTAIYTITRDFSGHKRHPNGLEYGDHDPVVLTIRDGDPLSAAIHCSRRIVQGGPGWRTRVEVQASMTADAGHYIVSTTIDAFEDETRIHSRTFADRIPRNCS